MGLVFAALHELCSLVDPSENIIRKSQTRALLRPAVYLINGYVENKRERERRKIIMIRNKTQPVAKCNNRRPTYSNCCEHDDLKLWLFWQLLQDLLKSPAQELSEVR